MTCQAQRHFPIQKRKLLFLPIFGHCHSVDECCLFSIIPTHCLLLLSTTPCFQSPSHTFSACPFSFVLLSSIVLPALHGFHPPSAMFCELHQLAIGNLSFSLMKQVGRNSYVSFLVCRRFHCSRDLGEVSCSQSFWLYVHLRSKLSWCNS